jgi:hypothetical protein
MTGLMQEQIAFGTVFYLNLSDPGYNLVLYSPLYSYKSPCCLHILCN